MNLQDLRYVVALADSGHFARAAEACHVTQSTLSTQLKKLEDDIGLTLFDRSLRRVAATAAAQEIVASARRILQEAEHIRSLAKEASDPMARTLTLGAIPTAAPYVLPRLLEPLRRRYPRLRLLLREGLTDLLLRDLAEGRIDAALVAVPVPDAGLHVESLFDEAFHAALPAGHPLARQKTVAVEDLPGEQLLLLEDGHCLREQALNVCRRAAGPLAEEIRATSLETLRQMVGLGIGYTLMPAFAVPEPARRRSGPVEYRPFRSPAPSRTLGLVWRPRSPNHQTLLRLAEVMRLSAVQKHPKADKGGPGL